MKHRARGGIVGAAVSLGLAAAPSVAQAREDPEWQLTGGSSRAWVLRPLVRPPIPGDACVSGAVYTFAATHDLTVSLCRRGRIVSSLHAWSVSDTGEGGTTLAIGGMGTYRLTFQPAGQRPRLMRLRPRDAAPLRPATDEEFSLDED